MREATKAERDAVSKAWDNIPEYEPDPDKPLKGNPTEKAVKVFGQLIDSGEEAFPNPENIYPDEDDPNGKQPTPEEEAAYFDALARVKKQREKYLVERIEWMLEHDDFMLKIYSGPDRAWYNEFRNILQGRSVQEWMDMYEGRFDSDEYYYWKQSWDMVSEGRDYMYDQMETEFRENMLGEYFTLEEFSAFNQYKAMPNETEEDRAARKEFGEDNPVVYEQTLAYYNPEGYRAAVQEWGSDFYSQQANIPTVGNMFGASYEDITDAQRQEYFDAKDRYFIENPNAEAIRLWLNGRPMPQEVRDYLRENGEYEPYDFGVEYAKAIERFGEDIFQINVDRSTASQNDRYFDYINSHEDEIYRRSAFEEWNNWYYTEGLDLEAIAEDMLYEIQKGNQEALNEAVLASQSGGDILIPGPPVSAPNWWRGEALPGVGLLGENGTPGLIPADLLDDPAIANLVSERGLQVEGGIQPDPKQLLHPSMQASEIPGLGISWADAVYATPSAAQQLDDEIPGLGKFIEYAEPVTAKQMSAEQKAEMAEPLTMEELLATSDTWQKLKENERKAYVRQEFASSTFGVNPRDWEMYFNLPKGSGERKAMLDAKPELEAALLFSFNQDKWKIAQDAGFTMEDVVLWARRPDYNPDDTGDRTAFFNANPKAFLFNTWINGRPGGKDSDEPDYTRNWGVDYRSAQERFGKGIWDLVVQYRGLPKGTGARTRFREDNPQYGKWEDWWYSNLDSGSSSYYNERYGGSGGWSGYTRFSSYGGWGGGGSSTTEKLPDGGIYVRPRDAYGIRATPTYRSGLSQTADNWRRFTSTEGSRLFNWKRSLG
jgi:adenylate cyclase class IV